MQVFLDYSYLNNFKQLNSKSSLGMYVFNEYEPKLIWVFKHNTDFHKYRSENFLNFFPNKKHPLGWVIILMFPDISEKWNFED